MQEGGKEEIWKDVVGYTGLYKVSSLGVVKRLPKSFIRQGGKPFNLKEKILKPNRIKGGYYQLKLTQEGNERSILLHRIVCEAFHGPAPAGRNFVNHKDTNKENNTESNLEWCSFKENMEHAALHGLRPRGSGNHYHILLEYQVLEICNLLDTTNLRQIDIANMYGVRGKTVNSINIGASWNWLTKRKKLAEG